MVIDCGHDTTLKDLAYWQKKQGQVADATKILSGPLVATPGALEALKEESFWPYIKRHANGDWGDVCAEDKTRTSYRLKRASDCFQPITYRMAARSG